MARLAGTFAAACLAVLALPSPAGSADLVSPNGRAIFSIDVDDRGVPRYALRYDDEQVIEPSRIGLRFAAVKAFDRALAIVASDYRVHDETWEQPWGERRRVREYYNERSYTFESTDGDKRRFTLRARLFDDGLGFRYELPAGGATRRVDIVDELTEFRVPEGATAWWIPGRGWNRYEYLYRETALDAMTLAHTPATFRLPGGTHLSIHEAALVDYPAFVLDQRRPGVFQANLTPWSDGTRAKKTTPFETPWRTIQFAADAVGLLNSDLILNLNEANRLGDVSWVEPGKYVGIWWAMHLGRRTWGSGPEHGATTNEARRYVDFAADNGFAGVLVEGWNRGWDGDWFADGSGFSFTEAYPDFDIEAVAAYALGKGVRLIGHHETSGHVTNYERQLADALGLYESLGVRAVKTGYVADGGQLERVDGDGITHYEWHDGQFGVNHYLRVVEEAAKRRISINTHEPVKATGLRRTYPNWVSREGARGQEFNAWWQPPNPPSHTATLPFTRMLAGPMDFTPGIFDLTFAGPDTAQRVQTTLVKQLALYVVLYSPIQMVADLPENYAAHADAFRFIVDVPTDWEQSIALAGEVGRYVVFARRERGGDDWYVGAVGDEDARTISLPLAFLSPDRTYEARIYRDGDDAHWEHAPYDYEIEEIEVTRNEVLELRLAAGGGVAIRLAPLPGKQQARTK